MDFEKTIFASLAFLARYFLIGMFLCGISRAETQFTVGSIIRGFEMPQVGSDGKLRTKIRGEEALVMSANQIRIKNLFIEIYDETEQPTTGILSPECIYWRMEDKLTAEKNIEVKRPGMLITAQNMEWHMGESKGAFRNNVKVIVQPGIFNPQP
ncbi:MAG: hypothetical protein ACOY3I_09430 [Verrucomicrobiota bacterium]